jgi:alkaline phosphatase
LGTFGVNLRVKRGDFEASNDEKNHVTSIMTWAQKAGKATGIVTTTRVTHASPAATYAHTAERKKESDGPGFLDDIATQLIRNLPGKNFNVIYGGGRQKFLSKKQKGERFDGLNMIDEWINANKTYISNRQQLLDLDTSQVDQVLGLFSSDHFKYHLEDEKMEEPTLEEMTRSAIDVVKKNKNGFVLFVEGGKIDLAHHSNYAKYALDETSEMSKAVRVAMEMTDEQDTLIVVTADHAHAGEDVPIFARGPFSHLFSGVMEQNTIPHIMAFASCIGDGLKVCDVKKRRN